jgi:hypothetical protein
LTPSSQSKAEKEEEARKRSEAAKKAAATRKKNEEEEAKAKEAEKPNGDAKDSEEKPNGDAKDSEEKSGEEGPIPGKFSQEAPPEVRLPSAEELAAQEHEERVKHNELTGGGDVHKDELQAQRDEHNRRTAGISA